MDLKHLSEWKDHLKELVTDCISNLKGHFKSPKCKVLDQPDVKDTLHKLQTNEKVAKDNYECLTKLKQPISTVNTKHNNTTALKLPADDMGSLMPQLLISKAAKVMLTRNL